MSEQPNYDPAGNWYVASLVLQVREADYAAVKNHILTLPYTEITAEVPAEGKIVVVTEAGIERDLVTKMEGLEKLDGVMALSLVYSERDEK